MLIILGDRTEMIGVALAAMNKNIPIAHIHGGEITKGAVDDCIRHAITKLSYIHFASTETYRNRIIQLGEDPSRVFNVGALGVENILKAELYNESEIRTDLGIPADMDYAIITLHPETIDSVSPKATAELLCSCMETDRDTYHIITSANPDVGGKQINDVFKAYAICDTNCVFYYSLGMKKYLSALKFASFVLGNSSSGIIEAPTFGVPTINIGNRQNGRIMPESILSVPFNKNEILNAITKAKHQPKSPTYIYGDGHTSERMIKTLKQILDVQIDLKKGFYDLPINKSRHFQ